MSGRLSLELLEDLAMRPAGTSREVEMPDRRPGMLKLPTARSSD